MNKTFLGALSVGALLLAMAPAAFAALTSAQIQAIVSLLTSFGVPAATVSNVQSILNGTGPTTNAGGGSTIMQVHPGDCAFTTDLSIGSTGPSVECLQNYLTQNGCPVPAGATGYFGSETKAAVICWQAAHGLPSSGYFGTMSRGVYSGNPAPNVGTLPSGGGSTGGGTTPNVPSNVQSTPGQSSDMSTIDSELNQLDSDLSGLNNDTSNIDNDLNQSDDSDE